MPVSFTYSQLLDNAFKAYSDYLVEHKKVDKLWALFFLRLTTLRRPAVSPDSEVELPPRLCLFKRTHGSC